MRSLEEFWDRVIDLPDEPEFQCDVPSSLDDDHNDDCKYILMGILNVLLLELILRIALVF